MFYLNKELFQQIGCLFVSQLMCSYRFSGVSVDAQVVYSIFIIESKPKKRVSVKDLIQILTKAKTTTTGRSTRKVPSWHLTSQEALKYIKDSHKTTQEKERKEQEKAKITKEVLKKTHATKKTSKQISVSD